MKNIVILGAGTAGTMMANKLVRGLADKRWRVTVVDQDDLHVYQPGLLFLPFDAYREGDVVRPRRRLIDSKVDLRLTGVDRVAPDEKRVYLAGGRGSIGYDVLIVATGSRIVPGQTPGLTGEGWRENAFDFYSLEGALALRDKLSSWKGGRLVLDVVEMPIKCPVAPLEFLFLAEAFFTRKGMRNDVEIVYATPLEGAFTKPRASAALGHLLAERNIRVVGDFNASEVDGKRGVLRSFDGREEGYDLLVTVPMHAGAEVISKSQLGDASGWFPTDKHTLQSTQFPDVFALGDATDLPSSKAGAVAHFQSEVLFDNVLRHIEGRDLSPDFDGHANCFIETGYGKAMLIDFNYTTEPMPGRFPLPGIGPFTLLEESETNHWGKLAFKWIYWNLLLEGKELPLDHRMLMAGKWSDR
jgi:sulfide:quinone oxidoreductase